MASARLVAVVIYDSVLYNRSGQVRRWADRVERRFVANAKAAAPARSGELRRRISGRVTRVGPRHLQTVIRSGAPHSLFVIKGTTGPIMSRRLWGFRARTGLTLPRGGEGFGGRPNIAFLRARGYTLNLPPGGGHGRKFLVSVSGQEANNFFAVAADATARRHSSLRGFSPGRNF